MNTLPTSTHHHPSSPVATCRHLSPHVATSASAASRPAAAGGPYSLLTTRYSLLFPCLAAFLLCLSCTANAAPKSKSKPPTDFSPFESRQYQKDGLTLPYRILYPEAMQTPAPPGQPPQKYPLFLFLHGMGKRGTDNTAQLDRGGELFLTPANRKQYPCIALYPQAPQTSAFVEIIDADGQVIATGGFAQLAKVTGASSSQAKAPTARLSPYGNMVMDVLNQLIASGIVDTNRIYIAGSSMGGFSTYAFITQYPDLFAAAAPMAGAADISKMSAWAGKVPIWIFHGGADPTVPVEGDRAVFAKLKEMGVDPSTYKYTEYPGVGHPSWDKAFAEPDFLKWFFEHKKK